ncbi:MAG: helix-turn-helix domain-containing protein [Gammaproteobacteria bacterium SHHR-1]
MTGIEKAIAAAGSQQRLAELLGVTQQAVAHWLAHGKIPYGRVVDVEIALEGVVKREELAPELYRAEPQAA